MDKRKSDPMVPRPGEGRRGETGYLGYLLMQAGAANRLRLERAMAGVGVTPPQFLVLTMTNAYPGVSNADLARLCALTPQTVNLVVRNLERDGALARRPHPVHGRIRQIELTAAGRALLSKCRRHARAADRHLSADLTAREEATIRRWLVRIAVEGQVDAG